MFRTSSRKGLSGRSGPGVGGFEEVEQLRVGGLRLGGIVREREPVEPHLREGLAVHHIRLEGHHLERKILFCKTFRKMMFLFPSGKYIPTCVKSFRSSNFPAFWCGTQRCCQVLKDATR